MFDSVECIIEIDRRQRSDVTSIDLPTYSFDSVEHNVVRTVVRPVSVLCIGENVTASQV